MHNDSVLDYGLKSEMHLSRWQDTERQITEFFKNTHQVKEETMVSVEVNVVLRLEWKKGQHQLLSSSSSQDYFTCFILVI